MKIASFTSNIPTMGETRTYEDFYKYLGVKPTRLGIVSRMYDDLTASFLTESLKNIFTKSIEAYEKDREKYIKLLEPSNLEEYQYDPAQTSFFLPDLLLYQQS